VAHVYGHNGEVTREELDRMGFSPTGGADGVSPFTGDPNRYFTAEEAARSAGQFQPEVAGINPVDQTIDAAGQFVRRSRDPETGISQIAPQGTESAETLLNLRGADRFLNPGDPAGVGSAIDDQLMGLLRQEIDDIGTKSSRARADALDDLNYDREAGLRGIERDRRNALERIDDQLGRIGAEQGDAKRAVSGANESFALFMDAISPGFSEAVDEARKAAKATAAVEAVFTETSEEIDNAYASSSGRVRAVAAKVAGAGGGEVAQALTDTIYEMKGFIDQQTEVSRESTLQMHEIAARIAGAAAEAEFYEVSGEAAREKYSFQAKYQKILTNLARDRSELNAHRKRSIRNFDEEREEFLSGIDRKQFESDRDFDRAEEDAATRTLENAQVFRATADPAEFYQYSVQQYLATLPEGQQIPASDQELAYQMVEYMDTYGLTDYAGILTHVQSDLAEGVEPAFDPEEVHAMMRYEDQLEVARLHGRDARSYYDENYSSSTSSPVGFVGYTANQYMRAGMPRDEAIQLALDAAQDQGLFRIEDLLER
jgi:hypothetical protein